MTENNDSEDKYFASIADDESQRIICNQDFLLTSMIADLNGLAAPKDNEVLVSKSVTIILNGAIVSGLLISGLEYGRIFVENLKEGYRNANIIGGNFSKFSEEDINVMVSSYEKLFEDMYKKKYDQEKNKINTTFFHMKDVVLKFPDGTFSRFSMFRGKIKDVNGFTTERQ